MTGLQYYIIDCETTGLDSKLHEITEISIIRYKDRVQLTQNIICDYPERASYDALRVTKKTIEDLSYGVTKEEAITKIDKFLEEDNCTRAHRCFIGHNVIPFDKKFLHAIYEKVNKELQVNLWMDTLSMMRTYGKQQELAKIAKLNGNKVKYDLQACCDILGIKKFSNAHSSKVDTRNNYLIYQNLVEEKKFDHLPFIKTFVHSLEECQQL